MELLSCFSYDEGRWQVLFAQNEVQNKIGFDYLDVDPVFAVDDETWSDVLTSDSEFWAGGFDEG